MIRNTFNTLYFEDYLVLEDFIEETSTYYSKCDIKDAFVFYAEVKWGEEKGSYKISIKQDDNFKSYYTIDLIAEPTDTHYRDL